MAEDDVLRMRAVLLDQASGALSQLRRNLGSVGKDVDTSKAKREFVDLGRTISSATGSLTGTGGLMRAFSQFRGAGGGIVVGVAAIGAAFYGMGRQLQEFANKTADLKFTARDMGVSIAALKAFQRAAQEVRIDPGAATQALQTFIKNAEDFRLRIGSVREELYKLGAGDVVEAIRRAQNPMDALRIAFERMQELQRRDPATARRFAETMFGTAAAARMTWQEIQRLNGHYEASGRYTQEAIERSEAFRKKWEELDQTLTKLKERTLTPLFPAFTAGLEAINTALDKTKAGIDWLSQHMPGGGERAPNLSARGGANQQQRGQDIRSWWEQFLSGPGSTRLGTRPGGVPQKETEDLKKQSGDLAENFKKMNFELARPGGGGGSGIINASFGGGGGGGFRGFGGGGAGTVPRTLGGGGGGAGAGGGGGGGTAAATPAPGGGTTRGDRNNNPGNLKFGDVARSFGATGADDRGFAIFPNRESGAAAQEALISSDRYKGLTLQQFAGKYAEGSRDWMQTVGKGLGIGPGDVVNNQDPRLPGLIRKAEGTGRLGPASVGGIDPHKMDPMAPAGSGITREKLGEVTSSRGRKFKVAAWAAPNFQRFIDNYEKAGGDLGPDTGTLGTRPGNRSYHPLGRAIDINQIGYGVRSRGGRGATLPLEVEDRLAEDAGLWPGSRFGDQGHFEARNRALVEAKQAEWERQRVNAAIGNGTGAVKAEGTVNVNVHAGAGTKVEAKGDGLFQNTRVHRYRQMDETGVDGGAQ